MAPWVLVTSREEKSLEARRMGFAVERVALELEEPQALDPFEVVEAKARSAWRVLQRPVLVEDSGLHVRAWAGFPGALVKWIEESAGIDAIPRMLDAWPDRSATASCVLAAFDGVELVAARGEVHGKIAGRPRGSGGFGWDTIFEPEGETRTFAEMTTEEKDRISHRRRAWEALARRLRILEPSPHG
jgi:non-canonical purine NTP pyrophosphatase (RdgB/HAM1 family)